MGVPVNRWFARLGTQERRRYRPAVHGCKRLGGVALEHDVLDHLLRAVMRYSFIVSGDLLFDDIGSARTRQMALQVDGIFGRFPARVDLGTGQTDSDALQRYRLIYRGDAGQPVQRRPT